MNARAAWPRAQHPRCKCGAGGGGEGRRFAVKTCGAAARRGRVTVQLLFFMDLCSHLFLDSSSAKRYQNGIAEMNSLLSKTVQVESLQVDRYISIPAIYAKDARFRSFFQLLQSQSAPEFAIWESTMLLSQFLERPTKHRSACRSRLRLDITKTDKHSCYIIIT